MAEEDVTGAIRIRVAKKNLPPGTVLLEDAAALAAGIHDALARLVQYRLGYSGRGRLPAEAKQLAPVVLIGVSEGSGILECQPLDVALASRNPAILAATELVSAIQTYSDTGTWPATLPGVVRNRIGAAVRSVITSDSAVELIVTENGHAARCFIDESIEDALQVPETFSMSEPVQLTGKVFDINVKSRILKIDAVSKSVAVPFSEAQLPDVDPLRWQRAQVIGYPADDRLKKLVGILSIRPAADNEEDGIVVPSELRRGEGTAAFLASAERLDRLDELEDNWNSYGAPKPHPAVLRFSRGFIRDVASVLLDYGLEPPTPFVAPTPTGGVQFEWAVGDRELELEVVRANNFQYLRTWLENEEEGSASRWEAMRFIKWVATGEEP